MMRYIFNSNAKEFIPRKARRELHQDRGCYVGSLASGEASYRVGTHARQEGLECLRSLGRLHPANENQAAYRATNDRVALALLL